jgi:hypothetical protein
MTSHCAGPFHRADIPDCTGEIKLHNFASQVPGGEGGVTRFSSS